MPDAYVGLDATVGSVIPTKDAIIPGALTAAMAGRTWNADRAEQLVNEHPGAYKDVDQVMADQHDLATVEHTLRQIFNYKG